MSEKQVGIKQLWGLDNWVGMVKWEQMSVCRNGKAGRKRVWGQEEEMQIKSFVLDLTNLGHLLGTQVEMSSRQEAV